ncbi:ribosomal protein S5 domain 2-type protein [Ustulina deusta]|nr:ribosomal protein S5 domain 2-type protein [Ustulina deusta]
MATTSQHLLLSPAELAYLHSTLSLSPPIRPDGRTATQFRPLTAETGILPGTNGSARVCFADGTEAVVGVKAEVEKTVGARVPNGDESSRQPRQRRRKQKQQPKGKGGTKSTAITTEEEEEDEAEDGEAEAASLAERHGENNWLELAVEIPGYRDDDSGTVFLATMLSEALLADGELTKKLWINRRFHWKLYLDIILISPPLSYPLPLLSLTTHLALLATRLPRLKSEGDEDPMFDDDWAASQFIYARRGSTTTTKTTSSTRVTNTSRPPITLLVMAVGHNVIFDPSKEELAVADCALAVSVGDADAEVDNKAETAMMDVDVDVDAEAKAGGARVLRLLSVRTIDPPSRLTAPGVPNAVNAAAWGQGATTTTTTTGAAAATAKETGLRAAAETADVEGVWKAPRGGSKISVMSSMVEKILEKGGVADEVLEGLDGVEIA